MPASQGARPAMGIPILPVLLAWLGSLRIWTGHASNSLTIATHAVLSLPARSVIMCFLQIRLGNARHAISNARSARIALWRNVLFSRRVC